MYARARKQTQAPAARLRHHRRPVMHRAGPDVAQRLLPPRQRARRREKVRRGRRQPAAGARAEPRRRGHPRRPRGCRESRCQARRRRARLRVHVGCSRGRGKRQRRDGGRRRARRERELHPENARGRRGPAGGRRGVRTAAHGSGHCVRGGDVVGIEQVRPVRMRQ
jgi:hypothetical protein